MRLVLDTNVVASGLLWGGSSAQLLDTAQVGEIELFTSQSCHQVAFACTSSSGTKPCVAIRNASSYS
jgi:predicted nucleic acid-binding protein